ncbi:MAG: hypothetical protein V1792_25810 [Pseudomonadota bacterium]
MKRTFRKASMIGRSQLTMKIPQCHEPKTGQSPEDRHSQAGAWEREEGDFQTNAQGLFALIIAGEKGKMREHVQSVSFA